MPSSTHSRDMRGHFRGPWRTGMSREAFETFTVSGHNGLRIVGDRRGDPSALPVIFLHGGGQTRRSWSVAADRLAAAGFCAITFDARGHGESAWSEDGSYCIEAMTGDLLAVMATVSGPPVLVGASMGGITSLVAAGEGHLPGLSGLVLVDIAPRVDATGVARIIRFMGANPGGFESLEQARDAIAAYNPHRPPPGDLEGLKKNLRLGADGRYRWHWDPRFLANTAAQHEAGRQPELERRLRAASAIRVPTLLVRGASSDIVSPDAARELLELIPHARAIDVAAAGHMVVGDRNDVFMSAITPFLQQLEATSSSSKA